MLECFIGSGPGIDEFLYSLNCSALDCSALAPPTLKLTLAGFFQPKMELKLDQILSIGSAVKS